MYQRPGNFLLVLALLLLLRPGPAWPWQPRTWGASILTGEGPVPLVGENQTWFVGPGDTLAQLARTAGLGYEALVRANPGIDPWLPEAGHPLLLPHAAILPGRPRLGITVNLAELRLFYLWQEDGLFRVRIYPVGIGDEGWETPEGSFAIRRKVAGPSWTPPPTIRRERPELPPIVPPGPDNPLGDYWLGFSPNGHGIHGTNRPYGVGRRVSRGCIRLYPEDIRDLFRLVAVDTPVQVVYRPVKVGIRDGQLFVEVHRDYLGRLADPVGEALRQARELGWEDRVDLAVLRAVVAEARGVPVAVILPDAGLRPETANRSEQMNGEKAAGDEPSRLQPGREAGDGPVVRPGEDDSGGVS